MSCHISYLKGFKFLKLLDCCFTRFLGPSVRPSVLAEIELDMVADMEIPKVAKMVVDNEKKMIMKKSTLTLT